MSKFTKGKWLLNKHFDIVTEDDELCVALCCVMPTKKRYDDLNNDNVYNEETRANARLIAAAPEMYKRLSFFTGFVECPTNAWSDQEKILRNQMQDAKELLARIDGEESKNEN